MGRCGSCGGGRQTSGNGAGLRTLLAPPEWDMVARQGNRAMIHPAGVLSDADYDTSGRVDAQMIETFSPPATHPVIVDFGCGDGRVTRHLATRYRRVVAVDASRNMLRLAEDRVTNDHRVVYVRDDGARLHRRIPPAVGQVDVIAALNVLDRLPHDHASQVLAGIAQTVRPGGDVIVSMHIGPVSRAVRDWSDVARWTALGWSQMVVSVGLVEVVDASNRDDDRHDFLLRRPT